MGINRKDALKRLNGLDERVREHLLKIATNPDHLARQHWEKEIGGWLEQMQEMISHVGKKTGAEWQARLELYQEQLG